jgi:SulP family sulfate permease
VAFWEAIGTINPAAVGIAAITVGIILSLRRYRPTWPGFLIAVVIAAALTALFQLPVETIGSRFGGMPRSLPAPDLPDISLEKVQTILPDAFALLGGIESLLSAVVADAMSGRRHRSNCELVAQGVANIASPLFGGICATGTIARTATNVRAGAVGPVSGMMHSVFLLLFILVAAPLASYVPLAALAGLLATVAWNMAERHEFAAILTHSRGEAAVLLATFLLTIFRDLTEGIAVGVVLGNVGPGIRINIRGEWVEVACSSFRSSGARHCGRLSCCPAHTVLRTDKVRMCRFQQISRIPTPPLVLPWSG